MHVETLSYTDGETTFLGQIAHDQSTVEKKPVVLIFHDWSGCNDFAKQKAIKLAELGYIGFAVDIFGDGKTGHSTEEKSALITPFVNNRKLLRKHCLAAFNKAKELPYAYINKIAAIGFCFGGMCALDLARSGAELSGVVSFHGLLYPNGLSPEPIYPKILVLHGYDDPMVPPAQVNAFADEMTIAKADWQIHMYGKTKHAFTNPQANDENLGTIYQPKAEKRSWTSMQNFLTEVFA